MTKGEAIKEAQNVKNCIISLNKSINDILNNTDEVLASTKAISSKISESIQASDIINNSSNAINSLPKIVANIKNTGKSIMTNAVQDGNKYLKSLEDSYNANLKEGEERLSLTKLSLGSLSQISGNGKTITTSVSINQQKKNPSNNQKKKTNNSSNNSSYSNNTTNNTNNSNNNTNNNTNNSNISNNNTNNNNSNSSSNSNSQITINSQIDKALLINFSNNINSSSIPNWDNVIQLFLKENNLDAYVKTISMSNNKVNCTLKNGKLYTFSNVSSSKELIDLIKNII